MTSNFDDKLRASLSEDDAAFLKDLESGENLVMQLTATVRGPMGWMSVMAIVFAFIFSAVMLWCVWNAFHVETVAERTFWLVGFIAALIPQGLLKLWVYNRANHLAVLRELKKIELRVARLAG